MIRVVLDTNVLVSAVISTTGPNSEIFKLVTEDKLRVYVTVAVLAEYDRVFTYEHLQHLDRRRVGNVLRLIKATAITVKSRGRLRLSSTRKTTASTNAPWPPRLTTLSPRTPGTSNTRTLTPKSPQPASSSNFWKVAVLNSLWPGYESRLGKPPLQTP